MESNQETVQTAETGQEIDSVDFDIVQGNDTYDLTASILGIAKVLNEDLFDEVGSDTVCYQVMALKRLAEELHDNVAHTPHHLRQRVRAFLNQDKDAAEKLADRLQKRQFDLYRGVTHGFYAVVGGYADMPVCMASLNEIERWFASKGASGFSTQSRTSAP